jgi:hypothetical protein
MTSRSWSVLFPKIIFMLKVSKWEIPSKKTKRKSKITDEKKVSKH